MAIFANVFDEETYVTIDAAHDELPCLRLESEEVRIDLLCCKEVMYRLQFVLNSYLNVPKDNQTKGKLINLQEVKQDVQED
ncbi:MAG: hypothetical protein Q8910_00635 [Bacteroidota bacterium]|nr:hypothetical protein [Bacteroidota bacterium]